MSSQLFTPYKLRDLTLKNRLIISPMCQYSAIDGFPSAWHTIHFGSMLTSGAGLFIIEATAVDQAGRITPDCLGLWSDEHADALENIFSSVRKYSSMPIGIQLSHAGRKASTHNPFIGRGSLQKDEGAWQTLGPSAIPFSPEWHTPQEMTRKDMDDVIAAFVSAAIRADKIGVDLIELHGAHGYLLSEFLSPIANQRNDEYGGSLENRMRFPLEVFEAVRTVWPKSKPMGVRCNGTDWHEGGIHIEETVVFAKELKKRGCDFVDVSTGGNINTQVPIGPSYQVPFAERVKKEVDITTIAVGLITTAEQAEGIVVDGKADLVAIGRAILNNPHWPWQVAEQLDGTVEVPWQYFRAATKKGVPPPYVR